MLLHDHEDLGFELFHTYILKCGYRQSICMHVHLDIKSVYVMDAF